MPDVVYLSDRIKELTYVIGTSNFPLAGPVQGFSSFSSFYSDGDVLFYAATNGSAYEVGSGVFNSGISGFSITRFPFKSTNNNQKVSFPEGVKEIYATYPATHAVYTGSGLADFNTPQSSGLAYWKSSNMLQYDTHLVWNDQDGYLGVNTSDPQYGIDLQGSADQSVIRSSGIILGSSGIYFPPGNNYLGGRQTTHYERNQLDQYAYDNSLLGELTGSNAVLQLSGVANQFVLFRKQNAGFVFAGPPSGCSPPCSPGYPSFRQLTLQDVPELLNVSGILNDKIFTALSNIDTVSGALNTKINNVSGVLRSDLTTVSGIINSITTSTTVDICQGRLTLEDGIAISYTDQVNKSIVYYAPLSSTTNKVSLYNGATWQVINFTQKSLTLFALSNNTNYDIFGYLNGGDLILELGQAWTNGNTRSQALTLKDDVLCKSNDLTRRYLGTIRTTSSSTTEDSAVKRFVWNANNRVEKSLQSNLGSYTWTYSTNQWRPTRNIKSSISLVNGYAEENIDIKAGVVYASDGSVVVTTTTTTTTTTSGPGTTTTTTTTTTSPSSQNLWTFGLNDDYQLGDNTTTQRNTPTLISASGWIDISCGTYHSAAIRNDNKLFLWGDNSFYQAGSSSLVDIQVPTLQGYLSSTNFNKVVCGSYQTFAIDQANRLWVGGRNNAFQLGSVGLPTIYNVDPNEAWIDIAAGDSHTIGIKTDGTLWGWGTQNFRNINPTSASFTFTTPTQIPLTGVNGTPVKVVSFLHHNLMLTSTGYVYSWGNNQYGQIGNNTTTPPTSFFNLWNPSANGNVQATDIACGLYHSLILINGGIKVCGRNHFGQLGDGTNAQRNVLVDISLVHPVSKIYAGSYHSLAIDYSGLSYSWGSNSNSQLGYTGSNQTTPTLIPAFSNVTKLASGFYHTLAIK